MIKLTVCPNYVGRSSSAEIADILFPFGQGNDKRLIVDNNLDLFNRYLAQEDRIGLVRSWVKLLIDRENVSFVRVDLRTDTTTLNDQDLVVNVSGQIPVDRRILADDQDDYLAQKSRISAYSICLYDRHFANVALAPRIATFNYDDLTLRLVEKAHQMTERRSTKSIEDIHNDSVVDYLRSQNGYQIADQSRAGSSASGKGAGELDIVFRSKSNGTIESIVEAMRLGSCGPENSTVVEHIAKLIDKYDTTGVSRSFVIVYAESGDFGVLWANYFSYIKNINSKKGASVAHQLLDFIDVSEDYNCKAFVRVGLAKHRRSIFDLEIVHIFINMANQSSVTKLNSAS